MSFKTQNIEFVIKPKEELVLVGKERTLVRVRKDETYPCQMQRTQAFACLFRHYAKHNGLCKDDLIFTFTDELQPDETPESVHMQPYDEIWVEHRKTAKRKQPNSDTEYTSHFRELLDSESHSDVTFIVGSSKERIKAHKAVLVARGEYFRALFRSGGMREAQNGIVEVSTYSVPVFKMLLEYIYTNRVNCMSTCDAGTVLELLTLANEYLLEDLKTLCENAASSMINVDNIGKMMLAAEHYKADGLQDACKDFFAENMDDVRTNEKFKSEIVEHPTLVLLLMEAWPKKRPAKRRRTCLNDGAPSSLNASRNGGQNLGQLLGMSSFLLHGHMPSGI